MNSNPSDSDQHDQHMNDSIMNHQEDHEHEHELEESEHEREPQHFEVQ